MQLMTKTRLTMAVHNCPDALTRIAKKLVPPDTPNFNEIVDAFTDAFNRYDSDTVDEMLEESVRRYLGTESMFYGFEQYCRKFGIMDDLSEMDNIDRILLIDKHRDEINRQLRAAGL